MVPYLAAVTVGCFLKRNTVNGTMKKDLEQLFIDGAACLQIATAQSMVHKSGFIAICLAAKLIL